MAYITGMDKTEVSDTATFQVGQKGMDSAGNTFKYVQYDTGAGSVAAVSGQVAYYYAPSGASAGADVCATASTFGASAFGSSAFGVGVLAFTGSPGPLYC